MSVVSFLIRSPLAFEAAHSSHDLLFLTSVQALHDSRWTVEVHRALKSTIKHAKPETGSLVYLTWMPETLKGFSKL